MKMMNVLNGRRCKAAAAILLAMCAGVFAQTTGQISGKVIDAKTGDALIGANVILVELSTGAAADMDGNYAIPNIPPGAYTLRFTYVSYTVKVVNNVAV